MLHFFKQILQSALQEEENQNRDIKEAEKTDRTGWKEEISTLNPQSKWWRKSHVFDI